MDCFAEPVIGRRFAPTRWLAMTGRACSGFSVMPGLDPAIHVLLHSMPKTWMAGTSPAMTRKPGHDEEKRLSRAHAPAASARTSLRGPPPALASDSAG